jgi:hypothetical protein
VRIIMKKPRRSRRAKNKIEGPSSGALIKVDPNPISGAQVAVHPSHSMRVARATIFTTELEEVIEIIARERVYRAMLAGLGRRLLMAPPSNGGD